MTKHTKKLTAIYKTLHKEFGSQGWWPADTSFEVIVGAILTQNTNWNNVEKAIGELKQAKMLCPHSMHKGSFSKLAKLIKSSGFFNQKAKRLKKFLCFVHNEYNGNLDVLFAEKNLRDILLDLSGIGPETADSIVLYAAHKPKFVIDAYTRRLLERIGISADSYDDAQMIFETSLSRNVLLYQEYHALIVELAKRYCKKKPVCDNCPLKMKKSCKFEKSGKIE